MTAELVLETSRPRAGRRFEPTHELALLQPALAACRKLPNARNDLLVMREMSGPIGIPDLTALVGGSTKLTNRLALNVPPLLNQIDAAIVSVCGPVRALTISTIAKALGWPSSTISRRLPYLVRNGALKQVSPERYVRPADLTPLGRLYAVETKVRDWGAALHQARSYSVWADAYVLVMGPLAERVTAQLLAEIDKDKAGLVVDNRMLRRPAVHRLKTAQRLWASEHLIAALQAPDGCQPSLLP